MYTGSRPTDTCLYSVFLPEIQSCNCYNYVHFFYCYCIALVLYCLVDCDSHRSKSCGIDGSYP